MIKSHGSYLYDVRFNETRVFTTLLAVSTRTAYEMMCTSEYVDTPDEYPGDEAFDRNAGLINKEWVFLNMSCSGEVTALYNVDGRYKLCSGDFSLFWAWSCAYVTQPWVKEDHPLRFICEDLAMRQGIYAPWEQNPLVG